MPRFSVCVRAYVSLDTDDPVEAAKRIRKLLEDYGGFKFLRAPHGHGGVDVLGPVGAREPWGDKTKKHVGRDD